jgi:hypothetical protein
MMSNHYFAAFRHVLAGLLVIFIAMDCLPDRLPMKKRLTETMESIWFWSGTYSAGAIIRRVTQSVLATYDWAIGSPKSVWRIMRVSAISVFCVFTIVVLASVAMDMYGCLSASPEVLRRYVILHTSAFFGFKLPADWSELYRQPASYYRNSCLVMLGFSDLSAYGITIIPTLISASVSFLLSYKLVQFCGKGLSAVGAGALLLVNVILVFIIASLAIVAMLSVFFVQMKLLMFAPIAKKAFIQMYTPNGTLILLPYGEASGIIFSKDAWFATWSNFFEDIVEVANFRFFRIKLERAMMNWSIVMTTLPVLVTFFLLLTITTLSACGLFVRKVLHQTMDFLVTHSRLSPWTLLTMVLTASSELVDAVV